MTSDNKIKITQIEPIKYLNCGNAPCAIPKTIIGSNTIKEIIKNSFLYFTFLLIKKKGANKSNKRKFFSEKYKILNPSTKSLIILLKILYSISSIESVNI